MDPTEKKIRTLTLTSTLFASMFIGALTYIAGCSTGDKAENTFVARCIEDSKIDPELVEAFNAAVSLSPDQGEFIRVDSATAQFLRFHTPPPAPGLPYAFGFGINKIRQLVANIDSANVGLDPGDPSRITGIRAYLTKRFTNVQGHPRMHQDVLLVAVRATGETYENIGDPNSKDVLTDESDYLLNTSSPCPDMCDTDK